ncbi:PREDICTED: trypsin beta [Drosophila arizonae]|uniref:Trypsin beta n=1 Tax=Drosophila arizonae TaxID=7263 RepID=A0ABM1PB91_DROAR|nr:PREDICTED: trypsin beta [Drosophila arizonae]
MRVVFVIYFTLIQLGLSPECEVRADAPPQTEVQVKPEEFSNLRNLVMPPAVQRVIGGEVTTVEKVGGFIVSLHYEGSFVCGGSLVRERIVLSAAHCFLGRTKTSLWVVKGGVSNLNDDGPTIDVKDYVIPSAFDQFRMNMDVAVLLLAAPLVGKNIKKIELCKTKLLPSMVLTVSGWGLTDPDGTHAQQTLRSVSVPVIKKKKCKQVYQPSIEITNSMFCASLLGKKDACTFDSGGPFVYKDASGHKQLCGIVSFGIGCASAKYPGVYTDVNYVKPFILNTIQNFGGE